MAKNSRVGGGPNSRQVKEVGYRTGAGSREIRPGGVGQIGSSIGNKATDKGRILRGGVEPVVGTTRPISDGKFGNEVSLNVGKGGPGTGRNLWGKSGSQCTTGPVNPGLGRIANTKGSWPDTNR
jgi:hypothetical protein